MVNPFKKPQDDSANPAPAAVYNWRIYALAFSAAMGSAMFGYDSAFIGGTMSLPSFKKEFGLDTSTGNELAALKANIVSTFQAGCFFGVLLCYYLVEKLGRRWVLLGCGALFDVGAILQLVAAGKVGLIYAGRALTGTFILCRPILSASGTRACKISNPPSSIRSGCRFLVDDYPRVYFRVRSASYSRTSDRHLRNLSPIFTNLRLLGKLRCQHPRLTNLCCSMAHPLCPAADPRNPSRYLHVLPARVPTLAHQCRPHRGG